MNFKYNEKYRCIEYKQNRKRNNTVILLTEIENKLFKVLKDGQVHIYSELIRAMYDIEDSKFYRKNLRTNIMRLNKELKYFGTVKSIRGIGYRLEVKNG